MKHSAINASIAITLGLGLVLALLWLVDNGPPVAQAQGADGNSTYYVAQSCTGVPSPCYTTVQAAVDAADAPHDVIKVATGAYTAVNSYNGLAQVVYISKTVTIRGGYTAAFTEPPDPEANPTTLNAQGGGRVLFITGDISPTIEGLRIGGGDATGLDGNGGGVYIITATATLRNNQVFSNTANFGGGLYLCQSSGTLSGNTISANTAPGGAGLFLDSSPATISENTITANYGRGLRLASSAATISGNTISANSGGGLYLFSSAAMVSDNYVTSNSTAGDGGGLFLSSSAATISNNTITANTARKGGGLFLADSGAATISGNTIIANTASSTVSPRGGGLYLYHSAATISANTISANTADDGGGLYLDESAAALTNNVVTDNRANATGSGLYVTDSSPRLLHTTIARNNGGDGSGVYITDEGSHYSTVALTNTILVSQTVGVYVSSSNTATLEATLWGSGAWANEDDWGGAGTVITGTVSIRSDPAFVDHEVGDYHVGVGSTAVDAGVDAGVNDDIDNDPRPMGHGYDLGADELLISLTVTKQADPDPVQFGSQLTYTLRITNTGHADLHATVTDTLPMHVTPTQVLTWATGIITPGSVWTQQVVVTVEVDYEGTLANFVEVTTDEGATGVYTETSTSVRAYYIYLPLVLRQFEGLVLKSYPDRLPGNATK